MSRREDDMTTELIELGKRAVACKGFRIMNGMRDGETGATAIIDSVGQVVADIRLKGELDDLLRTHGFSYDFDFDGVEWSYDGRVFYKEWL